MLQNRARSQRAENLFGSKYIYAHTDEMRWRHLARALKAKDSSAAWCVRGGYGSLRLISRFARMRPPAKPKLCVGFSDVTALQVQLTERWGWPVLYGAVLAQLGCGNLNEADVEETRAVVFRIAAGEFIRNTFGILQNRL